MPNTNRPTISTHVLDTTRGEPAAGVAVTLWRLDGKEHVSQGTRETDADGRIADLAGGALAAGTYPMLFEGGADYKREALTAFFDPVAPGFQGTGTLRQYHIPLLMFPLSSSR